MKVLVGEAAQARLEALTRATVGVTVIKRRRDLRDTMPDRDYRRISRYFTTYTGRRKFWGTAFPLGPPGVFVTSAGLLKDTEEVKLRTAGNLEHGAQVLGIDPASGIGVLRADIPGIAPLTPAPAEPAPAEGLYVVCYPIDSDGELVRYLPVSLHHGQVSATGQSGTGIVSLENLLRTDHALPAGCLGGPLVDHRGEVAGMFLGSPDSAINYGVAIADVAPLVEPLSAGHPSARPYFGLGLVTMDARRRARFRIEGSESRPLIAFLAPGSPAEKAGVKPGDFLVAVQDTPVTTVSDAGRRLLRSNTGGEAVTLTLRRGTEEVRLPVTPGTRPARILLDPVEEFQEALEANLVEVGTGPTAQQGLRIVDLVRGGRGEKDDYKEGDVITAVEGKGVRRFDTFNSVVRSSQTHVFQDGGAEEDRGGKTTAPAREINTYFLSLDIRTADGERTRRVYVNLFPEALAPPIY